MKCITADSNITKETHSGHSEGIYTCLTNTAKWLTLTLVIVWQESTSLNDLLKVL